MSELAKHNVTVFRVLAGSKLYGTDLPTSDTDHIEATFSTDPRVAFNLGYDWKEAGQQTMSEDGSDVRRHDIRQFMHLAARGQTAFLESIFANYRHFHPHTRWEFSEPWKVFKANLPTSQMNLVGPALGYATSELKATFGETTGELGAERKEVLAKIGYSPKNAHHGLRILTQTLSCLVNGVYSPYPMDHRVMGISPTSFMDFLMDVKQGTAARAVIRFQLEQMISELEKYHVKMGDQVKTSYLPLVDSKERNSAINEALGEMLARIWENTTT